jgi:hypothetical protein
MESKINAIIDLAGNFAEIARQVNESSQRRKKHIAHAIIAISHGMVKNNEIEARMRAISKINIEMRNLITSVLHTCIILNTNIEYQLKFIKELRENHFSNGEALNLLENKINEFSKNLNVAQIFIYQILEINDRVILMNNLIIRRKLLQKKELGQLHRHGLRMQNDAEKAIEGSASNLQRGLEMAQKIRSLMELASSNDYDAIKNLIGDANAGWKIAKEVNKSSLTHFDFAEKVSLFTRLLYQDSIAIKELIFSRHDYSERNDKILKELPPILNDKFKEYLAVAEPIEKIEFDASLPEAISIVINNLKAHVSMVCEDINTISKLNYDMSEKAILNSEAERDTIRHANSEIEFYDEIKYEVMSMTEATEYPVEGSNKNIGNGQEIEKFLKELLKELG